MSILVLFALVWCLAGIASGHGYNHYYRLQYGENDWGYVLLTLFGPFSFVFTRSQKKKFLEYRKLSVEGDIKSGKLIAEGVPDPEYQLAGVIAAKIRARPSLLRSEGCSLGDEPYLVFEDGDRLYVKACSAIVYRVQIKGKTHVFKSAAARNLISKAVVDTWQYLRDQEAKEKIAEARQKALDAIEVLMELPKEPKPVKWRQKVVEGCPYSCCNGGKTVVGYRECDCDSGCSCCRIYEEKKDVSSN